MPTRERTRQGASSGAGRGPKWEPEEGVPSERRGFPEPGMRGGQAWAGPCKASEAGGVGHVGIEPPRQTWQWLPGWDLRGVPDEAC